MMFQKAERKKAKLRLGISGPSGSGKTYSSLLVAFGMTNDWDKIALIDTERGSGELYSDLGSYSVCQLTPPFEPQKYIAAINAAEDASFEVLIIDSLSHAWNGEGGMLEMVDNIAAGSKSGNSFTAWRDVTPWHNKLVNTILQSRCHIIVTVRSKTEYVMSEDGNGKKVPKKVGMAPVFRDGLEYEVTTFFDLALNHTASTSKDRTGLFDGAFFKPGIDTGKKLIEWLDSGADLPVQLCENCGSEIIKFEQYSVEQIIKNSIKKYGIKLCVNCSKKRGMPPAATQPEENQSSPPKKSKKAPEETPLTENDLREATGMPDPLDEG